MCPNNLVDFADGVYAVLQRQCWLVSGCECIIRHVMVQHLFSLGRHFTVTWTYCNCKNASAHTGTVSLSEASHPGHWLSNICCLPGPDQNTGQTDVRSLLQPHNKLSWMLPLWHVSPIFSMHLHVEACSCYRRLSICTSVCQTWHCDKTK